MSDTPKHPAFEIHPDLKSAPGVDAHHLARVSISGAEGALARITEILARRDGEPDVNALQWQLRSFFWELCGAWDLFQQWVNTAFQLGYAEEKVAMTVIRQATSDVAGWDEAKAILATAFDSDWHFEVRAYRNSAHRSYFRMMEIHLQQKGVKWLNLPAARLGQSNHFEGMVPQLAEYVRHTLDVGQQIADLKARLRK
jgi:hypothetical protein